MEIWSSVILCIFLSYLFLHLVLHDIVFLYETFNARKSDEQLSANTSLANHDLELGENTASTVEQMAGPEPAVDTHIQRSTTVIETVRQILQHPLPPATAVDRSPNGYNFQEGFSYILRRNPSNLKGRQSTIVISLSIVCDVILSCMMGYFYTFCKCWDIILTCITVVLICYMQLLMLVVEKLTSPDAIKYTSATAVLTLAIACVMLYIVIPY
jgi:hypothetical protein